MSRRRFSAFGDPFAVFCRVSHAAGLDPLAWVEMSYLEWTRAVARRGAS